MCEFVNGICTTCGLGKKLLVFGTRFKRGDLFEQMIERGIKAQDEKIKAMNRFTVDKSLLKPFKVTFQGWKEEKLDESE